MQMSSIKLGAFGATGAAASAEAASRHKAQLEKAAKGFEAVFTRQLIGSMRSAGFGDDLTNSSAVEQFQEMADARTADNLADSGGLGIARMLLSQLGGKDQHHKAVNAADATATAKGNSE